MIKKILFLVFRKAGTSFNLAVPIIQDYFWTLIVPFHTREVIFCLLKEMR